MYLIHPLMKSTKNRLNRVLYPRKAWTYHNRLFKFTVRMKDKPKDLITHQRDPHTIDVFTGQTDTESKNTPSWQVKGLSDAQIKKIGVYKQEFIDANTSKISPNDRRGYDEIFESWEPLLKDPNQVKNFKIVQDLLERKRQN